MRSLKNSKYTVLCVDDNKNNLFTLNALLSSVKDIKSIEVLGAKEALDVLLRDHVDLILCDVQMPDINGFELAKMIKSNKKTKHIPIIFVTAVFKSEEFVKQGFELGAIDYITKPIDDNQLLNKLMLYLQIFDEKNKANSSEKRLNDIVQSIGDGIYTLDLNNKTTFINDRALELLGFKYEDLIDKHIHEFIHYKDIDNNQITNHDCSIHATIKNIKEYKNEYDYLVKKDGSFLSVSIVAKPLYLDGEITGVVVIFRDKTNYNKVKSLEEEKITNQEQIIHSMIDMIEARDSYTAGHTKRVANYCVLIAKEMNVSQEEIDLLEKSAWLHDIGKISTPDSVLLKPAKLDALEYKLIQDHLIAGYEMLSNIDQYKDMAEVIREHHEKYDGSGYPRGLKADEISTLGRIMIVADAFDAMTTNRVYKPRKNIKVALEELRSLSAVHFHPEVVSASLTALKDIDIDAHISQLPKTMIEEQRFSYFYKDRLTNLFIIEYLNLVMRYYVDSESVYMYDIKLQHFSQYNDKFSWAEGDQFLVNFASFIRDLYDDTIAFRVEGDDFMLLSKVKLGSIEADIDSYKPLKDSVISFSVSQRFVKNTQDFDIISL